MFSGVPRPRTTLVGAWGLWGGLLGPSHLGLKGLEGDPTLITENPCAGPAGQPTDPEAAGHSA